MDCKYFDYNATTPLRPEAREAWLNAADECWFNPSSPYRAAARAHAHLQSAREHMAVLLCTNPERVIFNSGATEGNNAVFAHWAKTLPAEARIGVSPTEHPSVLEAAKNYFGDRIEWLKLNVNGAVDVAALNDLFSDNSQIKAVSVMAANNETGILNDWAAIAAGCHSQGAQYHCDASQWIGKLPPEGLDKCDFVTGCGHKFGGSRGVGFSLLPKAQTGFKSLFGGSQESGHRAGTEDVAGILAMVAALEVAGQGTPEGRDAFLSDLLKRLPLVEVVGLETQCLWNTVMLILPQFENTRWIRALEKNGFWVSSGSACSTGEPGPSTVLAAMGLEADSMRRAVRVSSGWTTTVTDWKHLSEAFVRCYKELRAEAENSIAKVISI
ncbi:MAG: cysteine desulfurase [Lentimonas sp.]|jgi:cysteine desulfurase